MKATLFILLLLMLQTKMVYADAEIRFSGTLVEEPCSLAPEDTNIEIDFGTVVNKMLYSHQRTPGKPFTLHLIECDLSLGKAFSIMFTGIEDIDQPGLIMLDPISTAKGVAFGIESTQGEPLPINSSSPWVNYKNGSNQITFNTYISANKIDIIRKKIIPGSAFTMINLTIDYK